MNTDQDPVEDEFEDDDANPFTEGPHSDAGWERVCADMKAAGVEFRLGSDWYDNSIEIYDVDPDWRPSQEIMDLLFKTHGYTTIYVNHTDKWETHYTYFQSTQPKAYPEGTRISYPHKRGEPNGSILLEKKIESWPKNWYESGKVKVLNWINGKLS